MKELVDLQTRDIERAFTMDNGPFVVAPDYADNKENPNKWVKRTKAYKERMISRIHKISLIPPPAQPMDSPISLQHSAENRTVSPLCVSYEDIGLSKEVFAGMWSKAAELVADETAITDAPGLRNSRMVTSTSSPRKPHLVTMFSNGKVTCDCLNYACY